MLISPPAWVNSTIRLSAAATQSMFSVPEVIETRAPEDSANHSTGTRHPLGQVQRGDHPRALRLGQRAQRLDRVAEQHHPGDAVRVPPGRRADHPGDEARGVPARRPVHRHQQAAAVQVVLGEPAPRPGQHAGQLVRVHVAAPGRAQHLLPVVVQRRHRLGRRRPDVQVHAAACVRGDPHRRLGQFPRTGPRSLATNWISSSPAPDTVGRIRCARDSSSSRVKSLAGQT